MIKWVKKEGLTINGNVSVCYDDDETKERRATCEYCRRDSASNTELPFYKERPAKESDSYYCGCRGFS